MKKINVVTALAFILSTSSYGAIMKGATILEEHSWITGGNEGSHPIEGHIVHLPKGIMSASALASTSDVSGQVYSNIYTSGYHSYRIDNNSGQNQEYTINLSLCAYGNSCFRNQRRINLQKGGYFYDNAGSSLACSFDRRGTFSLEAITDVAGESSAHDNNSALIHITK
ncbi:MAG: hypothetical protein H0T84_04575 [Tatlockia sp.]|nr:hypothetical protein [Tatlockia sp.]